MNNQKEATCIGGYVLGDEPIEYNEGYDEITLTVRNTGDRPIQVGSHFHFFETNLFLEFDRSKAFGRRLNIPSTTALRFEAGDEKVVSLVPFQGKQRVVGFNNLVDGWVGCEKEHAYRPRLNISMENVERLEFRTKVEK